MAYKPKEIEEFKRVIIEQIPLGFSLQSIITNHKTCGYLKIYSWMTEEHKDYDKVFTKDYARARQSQADFYADEIIDISDTEEDPAKARVRIDARKWKAGKMKPQVYGDKIDVTSDNKALESSKIMLNYNDSEIDLNDK